MTEFALDYILVKSHPFWFDGNGKITLDGGTYQRPLPNAFSLVQIEDCPGSTITCRDSCYVHYLEKNTRYIHDKYKENSENIRIALTRFPNELERAFAEWIKTNTPQGFRWHVSGDIFSRRYALFIKRVCQLTPKINHWIYTRSFTLVHHLVDTPNLVVNLSADFDNYWRAAELHEEFGFRVCYLTVEGEVPEDLSKGSVIFPAHELRGRDSGVGWSRGLPQPKDSPWWEGLTLDQQKMVCPPDIFGQSDRFRCGPCKKCIT